MSLTKRYQARDINWVLVPDLVDKVANEIKTEYAVSQRGLLKVRLWFFIDTVSQHISVDNPKEFLSLLKRISEQVSSIKVVLRILNPEGKPPPFDDFSVISDFDGIKLEFNQPHIARSLDLCSHFEEVLQLKAFQPIKEHIQRRRTVFIAHAFDSKGRSYAFQVTNFLSLLGFVILTGEGFAAEKVSSKVKRRLMAQDIVVVVVSKKDDFTWLIQEVAGADYAKKPIFLLIQEGVDFSRGILGDLEYISFPSDHISEAFTPILEGLCELGFRFS